MFAKKKTKLDKLIDNTIDSMELALSESNDEKVQELLVLLNDMTMVKDKIESKTKISPDTKAVVGANLLGILMVLNHERANVIASKAMSLLTKMK